MRFLRVRFGRLEQLNLTVSHAAAGGEVFAEKISQKQNNGRESVFNLEGMSVAKSRFSNKKQNI